MKPKPAGKPAQVAVAVQVVSGKSAAKKEREKKSHNNPQNKKMMIDLR